MALRIAKATDFSTAIRSIDGQLRTYLGNNPGSTSTEIATGMSENQDLVNQTLDVGIRSRYITGEANESGIVKYWKSSDFATLMETHIAAVRTWLDGLGANGATVSSLVTTLEGEGVSSSESDVIAKVYFDTLVAEGVGEVSE
jgi:hypothetical protein